MSYISLWMNDSTQQCFLAVFPRFQVHSLKTCTFAFWNATGNMILQWNSGGPGKSSVN